MVEGHAGAGERGSDIVCAAVSVLTRTIVRVLSGREGIVIRGNISGKGSFHIDVDYIEECRDYLAAAGDYLREGLQSVAEEFADSCMVEIEWRKYNGS